MAYIRIRSGQAYAGPDEDIPAADSLAGEEEIWPGSQGRPFVLVTHKAWRPPTDIYETPGEVVIKMELAGVTEDNLQITVQGDVLAVRGRRVDDAARRKIGYHHMGIAYGEFASDIQLPGPINQDEVRATYEAGFLTIALPKLRPRAPGTVRISLSAG